MNINKSISILFFVLFCFYAKAQDGIPVYSEYFADNLYILHPSMAGAATSSHLRLTARQQWFDQVNAPNLQTISSNVRVGEQSGIGAIFLNDQNGFHSQLGAYFTYAHHLNFSRSDYDLNQLSFGLTAGVIQSRLDETNFDLSDFDPVIAGIIQSSSYFNIDVGVSYNYLDFAFHFTVKNLIFQNRRTFTEEFESNNQRRFMASSGFTFGGQFYTEWTYEPSVLIQYVERTKEAAVDLNFKIYRKMDFGKLWGGISYRRNFDGAEFLSTSNLSTQKLQFISPVLGVNFNQFMFAYTYSQQFGEVRFTNGAFHQITLGLNFLDRGKYDCNCPAIN